jgi:hypothetical protein
VRPDILIFKLGGRAQSERRLGVREGRVTVFWVKMSVWLKKSEEKRNLQPKGSTPHWLWQERREHTTKVHTSTWTHPHSGRCNERAEQQCSTAMK